MTSFPERWDSSSTENPSLLDLMKHLVKRSDLSNGKQDLDARTLFHNVLKHYLEFKPTLLVADEEQLIPDSSDRRGKHSTQSGSPGQKETYLGVFNREIKWIVSFGFYDLCRQPEYLKIDELINISEQSREIDDCYTIFKDSVGKCDSTFLDLSARVTEHFMAIADVVHEIGITQQVHDHQAIVWKQMHGIQPKSKDHATTCNCESTQGAWEVINRSGGEIERTMRDAKRVQDRVSNSFICTFQARSRDYRL